MFDNQEWAALGWTETVTLVAQTGVPDTSYAAVNGVFGPKTLADLTLAIGITNTYNRMATSFRATPASVSRLAR